MMPREEQKKNAVLAPAPRRTICGSCGCTSRLRGRRVVDDETGVRLYDLVRCN